MKKKQMFKAQWYLDRLLLECRICIGLFCLVKLVAKFTRRKHRSMGRGKWIQGRYRKGPLSQKSAGHTQNRKTKTNTNPSPDPNRYRRRCPDPNARIQFIH